MSLRHVALYIDAKLINHADLEKPERMDAWRGPGGVHVPNLHFFLNNRIAHSFLCPRAKKIHDTNFSAPRWGMS